MADARRRLPGVIPELEGVDTTAMQIMGPPHAVVLWILRVTVALTCLGFAGGAIADPAASKWVALLVGVAGISVLVQPHWITVLLLSVFLLSQAVIATMQVLDTEWPALIWLGQSGRYMAPLLLLYLLLRSPGRDGATATTVEWVLRGTAAAVFFGHGVRALLAYPPFLALLELGTGITGGPALLLVKAIGFVDVVVAGVVLVVRSRVVVAYMALWGLITALSRVMAFGVEVGWPMVLVRTANFSVPLALLLWWSLDRSTAGAWKVPGQVSAWFHPRRWVPSGRPDRAAEPVDRDFSSDVKGAH